MHAALLSINPPEIIHLGKKLVGLDRSGSRLRLTFADGTRVEADAVIGADGVHSTVLEILFGTGEPRFTGQVAYRAIYRSELLGTEIDDRVKWWGPDRHIVTYKVDPRRDELYFIASTPEPDFKIKSWSARGDLDQMRAAFAGFHPDARIILDACPEVRKWALVERDPLARWSEDRIVLDRRRLPSDAALHGAGRRLSRWRMRSFWRAASTAPDLDGFADAFRKFERNRKERTSRIQLGARQKHLDAHGPGHGMALRLRCLDRAVELTPPHVFAA